MRFILIDEILELIPGRRITGVKHIAPDEDYFRDHFPGFPVVPGVLLTEMIAQTAGRCLDAELPERGRSMLGKIQSASFRHWVRPGDTAYIRAEVRVSRPEYAIAGGTVEVGDRTVATAELLFTFVAPSQFPPGYQDEVLRRFLESQAGQVAAPAGASSAMTRPMGETS